MVDDMIVWQEFQFTSFDCSSKTSVVEHCDYSKLCNLLYEGSIFIISRIHPKNFVVSLC